MRLKKVCEDKDELQKNARFFKKQTTVALSGQAPLPVLLSLYKILKFLSIEIFPTNYKNSQIRCQVPNVRPLRPESIFVAASAILLANVIRSKFCLYF